MALKPNIFKDVAVADVKSRCAPEFAPFIDLTRLTDAVFTMVCYPSMRGSSTSIVDSKTMLKAIDKIGRTDQKIIAIAHSFTEEARQLSYEFNALFFEKSPYGWTDARWAEIRDKYQ